MQNINNLCMQCMKDKGTSDVCPHCSHRVNSEEQAAPYLPPKTWLMDHYLVGNMINYNGEGVTYMGWDNVSQSAVLIREFLPANHCERDLTSWELRPAAGSTAVFSQSLASFLEMARSLARMRDLSSLLPVYDIFELGGTAYFVSEYVESITLNEFLLRNGNSFNFDQTRALMMPVLSTLSSLHAADILHRGISPETLLVGRDGKLRLTGFCTVAARTARTDLTAELFAGYAPIEQYGFDGQQGPWSDVYAFAATIYRMLVGNAPAEATARVTNDRLAIPARVAENLPNYAMTALANALQFLPDDRTASAERFRDEFSAAPNVVTDTDEKRGNTIERDIVSVTKEKQKEAKRSKRRSLLYTLVALVCTVAVLVTGVIIVKDKLLPADDASSVASTFTFDVSNPQQTTSAIDNINTFPVPAVAGLDLTGAKKQINDNFTITVNAYQFNDTVAKGNIITQSPAPGAGVTVTPGVKIEISVVISLGESTAVIPNVKGKYYLDAYRELSEKGFMSIEVIQEATQLDKPCLVTDIDGKTPGTKCSKFEHIIIRYSSDKTISQNTVSESSTSSAVNSFPLVTSKPEDTVSQAPTESTVAQ